MNWRSHSGVGALLFAVSNNSSITDKEHVPEQNMMDFGFNSESTRIEKFATRVCVEEDTLIG